MNPISLLLKLPISSSLISSVDFPNNITCPLLGVSIVEILFNEITGLSVISS